MSCAMNLRIFFQYLSIFVLHFSLLSSQNGILNVGFDIDDTILFSRDVFLNLPEDKRNPVEYGWINSHDEDYSLFMTPTVELVHFFYKNGHNVFFITSRSNPSGNILAKFLSDELMFPVEVNKNLFFSPKERIKGKRFTTKQRIMKRLRLDLFYGDADTDMIAALKAGVHPVRIVRHKKSIVSYGSNYFGNTIENTTPKNPFTLEDLNIFYSSNVGIFGESIYPIIWEGPLE
ncbi:MAG: HAD family acid phosphatase [Candidatus Neomarinimicrobiota bacterium]|jgi:acid phosphatase class B|nr:HAD family acid phosphatase [Candidatus Neomarinimicrobiota bacterium]